MVDGSEIRGSNVDGSLPGSSLDESFIVENFLVDNFLVDGSLVGSSGVEGNLSCLRDQDKISVVSQSVSMGSELMDTSLNNNKGGRPRKIKRAGGRPKRDSVGKHTFANKSIDSNDNMNINFVPEFLSIDLLDIPFGPMPNDDNRIFTDDIVFSRPEINSLWSDPNMWLQDSFVFIYLKFLSYRSNLNVVVVSPQFAVVDYHFGQGVEPPNIFDCCFNYNQDYDILLIPIIFPGHFGLVVFDRSDRANLSCIFVDSLPSVNRLTDVSCGVFDQRRVDLIKRCICDLTPGLFIDNINIQVLPRSQFTEQRDGINSYSRIMSFKYAFLSHIVIPLSIHLPDNQKIYFTSKNASKIISAINAGKIPDSRLSAYWKLCISDSAAKNILFENIPETYAFNKNDKVWKKLNISEKNKNRKPRIGRIYTVSPRDPELFALYILTKHFPGTPKDLLTVNGHECQTFAEAARLRGLFEDNNVWERTLREGSISLNPSQMRQLFANILVFGGTEKCVIDGLLLWNMFVDHFYDRRCTEAEKLIRIDRALAIIEKLLLSNGRSLQEFNLPLPNNSIRNNPDRALDEFFFPHHINDDEMDEAIDTSIYDNTNLNPEQQRFFNLIRASVLDPNTKNKLFFLSGDGGTGKTFLLNYIIYKLREMRLKVLATASTGI
nr:unnamed protein product [Meloidogyne enterolobii]